MKIMNKIMARVHEDYVPDYQSDIFVNFRQKANDELFDYVEQEIKSYALSVVRKAVEEEKGKWVDEKVLIVCDRILTQKESNLK